MIKLSNYDNNTHKDLLKKNEVNKGATFVAAEVVAGISVGSVIGYYIDQYLNTKVLFLLIFVILGLISSLYNIYVKNYKVFFYIYVPTRIQSRIHLLNYS